MTASKRNLFKKPNNEQNESIKSLVDTVLYNSLAQAIVKIVKSPHILIKLYLFIFVISACGFAAYMVINAILTYLSYGVITTSRTVFEIPAPFPAITICNANMFTTEYALEFLKRVNAEQSPEINVFDDGQIKNVSPSDWSELNENISYRAMELANRKSSNLSRVLLGHDLSDILLKCVFNQVKCGANDFTLSFDPTLGNCYTFNSLSRNSTTAAGPFYGLQMQLYVNYHHKLTNFNQNGHNFYNSNNAYGAVIFIDNSSSLTDHTFSGGIQIQHGMQTNIVLERKLSFVLPKPYSSCDLHSDSPSK